MIVEILLTVAQVVVFLYDVVTYPIYHVMAKINAKKQEKSTTPRATMVKQSSETISWKREKSQENAVYREYIIDNKVDTVTKAFNYAVAKYGSKNCLGTRQVLGETEEMQKNGKMFKKLSLGDYTWMNYDQTHSISKSFGAGLRELGVKPHDAIAIYA